MKKTGIYTAGAVTAFALAAVTVQISSPHPATSHDESAAPASVTVQHWAGGTYTPSTRTVHVTSLERSATHVAVPSQDAAGGSARNPLAPAPAAPDRRGA